MQEESKKMYRKPLYISPSWARLHLAQFTPFGSSSPKNQGLRNSVSQCAMCFYVWHFVKAVRCQSVVLVFGVPIRRTGLFVLLQKCKRVQSRVEWAEDRVYPCKQQRKLCRVNGMLSLSFRSHCGLRVRLFHSCHCNPFGKISLRPWFYAVVPSQKVPPEQFSYFYMAIYWQPLPLTTIRETTPEPPRRFITYARPHTNCF